MRLLGLNRWLGTALVLLPFVYVGFTIYGVRRHWGHDQWGDFATWISGIATSTAVLVALWQTNLARREAKRARDDAAAEIARVNERLTKELEAADARLARELDASRRMEQVRTIPPIWNEVAAVSSSYVLNFKEVMREGPANTDVSVDAWMAAHVVPFQTALAQLELAFSPSVMLISEPNTQGLIVDIYKKTREIPDLVSEAARVRLIERRTPDLTQIEQLLKEIRQQRKPITNAVREHITQVPPLDDSDGE